MLCARLGWPLSVANFVEVKTVKSKRTPATKRSLRVLLFCLNIPLTFPYTLATHQDSKLQSTAATVTSCRPGTNFSQSKSKEKAKIGCMMVWGWLKRTSMSVSDQRAFSMARCCRFLESNQCQLHQTSQLLYIYMCVYIYTVYIYIYILYIYIYCIYIYSLPTSAYTFILYIKNTYI